jgi:hypothetical protein
MKSFSVSFSEDTQSLTKGREYKKSAQRTQHSPKKPADPYEGAAGELRKNDVETYLPSS